MADLSMALGKVVQSHRKAAGITQEELADRTGLHRTYVSLLERGKRNPSVGTLVRVADVLGVRASALLAEAEDQCTP